ncbi:MAG: L-erythro-3,5-diaminohexanoate dehydrogenase, partial [Nocardioidaceae bacterium]
MTEGSPGQGSPAPGSPIGLHRVLEPAGVLPQAAQRLDARRELWPDEVRVRVSMLNLDAASYRQLERTHTAGAVEGTADGTVDGAAIRAAVLDIVGARGKMQNPQTGSGGMLVGTVEEVGEESPLGLHVGDRVATLVSLTLTPLVIEDGLRDWDGLGERVPTDGYAVLFGRSIAAVLPDDLPTELSLSVLDVCGAPALTSRVVRSYAGGHQAGAGARHAGPVVAVVGGAGKSGSLSLAAARDAGASLTIGVVPHRGEADLLEEAGIADRVVVADARDPVALSEAVRAAGGPADVTVVCV